MVPDVTNEDRPVFCNMVIVDFDAVEFFSLASSPILWIKLYQNRPQSLKCLLLCVVHRSITIDVGIVGSWKRAHPVHIIPEHAEHRMEPKPKLRVDRNFMRLFTSKFVPLIVRATIVSNRWRKLTNCESPSLSPPPNQVQLMI